MEITNDLQMSKAKKIKRGDKIMIDKGSLGSDFGTFISVRGFSIGGYWGFYKDIWGNKRIWDETVHKIIKL